MTKVHKYDPTRFPNIFLSKKKAQHNFCSFKFSMFMHKVFHHYLLKVYQSYNIINGQWKLKGLKDYIKKKFSPITQQLH